MRSRWATLFLLCTGVLMIVLDVTVVNVALPAIQEDLGFSQAGLAWVVNAYLIAFGGLLLLAGRLGDLWSRRDVFLVGMEEGLMPHARAVAENGIEEERRLAYVGITRAMTTLTLTFAFERARYGRLARSVPSRFLFEAEGTEVPEGWTGAEAMVAPGGEDGAAPAPGGRKKAARGKPGSRTASRGRGRR